MIILLRNVSEIITEFLNRLGQLWLLHLFTVVPTLFTLLSRWQWLSGFRVFSQLPFQLGNPTLTLNVLLLNLSLLLYSGLQAVLREDLVLRQGFLCQRARSFLPDPMSDGTELEKMSVDC